MAKKKGAAAAAADGAQSPRKASELSKQIDQIEHSNLFERLDRLQSKVDDYAQENDKLRLLLGKQKEDQADIYEFLKQKLMQKDSEITTLEDKVLKTEEERERVELELESKLETEKGLATETQLKLNEEINTLKEELAELAEFKAHKADLETELEETKSALANERKEHANVVSELERKVVQEKDRLKREMLAKIKEAKSNLLKMTDSQLATTTKRTILDNEQMSTELAYQSKRTVELIQANSKLQFDNKTIKRRLDLLLQEQEEAARRNNSSQKVVKLLLNKLAAQEEAKREERLTVESRKDMEIQSLIEELSFRDEKLSDIMRELGELRRQNGDLLAEREHSEADQQRMLATLGDSATFLLSILEDTRNRAGGDNMDDLDDENFDSALQRQPSVLQELNLAERERMLRFMLARLSDMQRGASAGAPLALPSQPHTDDQTQERPTTTTSLPPIHPPKTASSSGRRPPSTPALYSFSTPLDDSMQTRPISTAHAAMMGTRMVSSAVQTDSQPRSVFFESNNPDQAHQILMGPVREWGAPANELPLTRHSPSNYLRKGQSRAPGGGGTPKGGRAASGTTGVSLGTVAVKAGETR